MNELRGAEVNELKNYRESEDKGMSNSLVALCGDVQWRNVFSTS